MLGCRVVAELIESGYDDIVLVVRDATRLATLYSRLGKAGIDFIDILHVEQVELTDTDRLAQLFKGVDVVFNCAAKVSMEGSCPEALIENNLSIARSAAEAALRAKVGRFVHVSSISALGDAPEGKVLIDEECRVSHPEEFSPYGQSKQAAEGAVWEAAARGLKVTVVLPSVILGEGDWYGSGSASVVRLAASGLPFATSGVVGYVDVCDVARAMRLLSEKSDTVGERFILSASNLSFRELMTRGAEAAGRPRPFITLGRGAISLAWRVSALLRWSHIADTGLTRAAARSATERSFYDGTKIERYCDFEYTPVVDTITRVVAAYVNDRKKPKRKQR